MNCIAPRLLAVRTALQGSCWIFFLLLIAVPSVASADHCKLRFSVGFQLIGEHSVVGMNHEQVAQTIQEMFGTRQPVCEEAAYRYFLTQFTNYATTAFHKAGAEREAMLSAAQEILKRVPSQVFYKNVQAKVSAYKQIRADLSVVATEVGLTPSIQSLLDALDKLGPPEVSRRPEPMNDDAIPIGVPAVPLPPWAVISLHEIYDHAQRKQNGAVITKTALILEWMKLVTSGTRPGDIRVFPTPSAK